MGVDVLSCRQVTFSGCVPAEAANNSINRSSVKRCLFGPVDHNEAMSFFEKEMAKMEKEKMNQYNFDFVQGKPLKGAYQWQKVSTTFKVTKVKSPKKTKCPVRNLKNRRQTTITDYIKVTKCSNNNNIEQSRKQ
ncbi:uncharacterized protein LOC135836341 [Planococcus citri]|uniref:uncharacterized protein LOC135836341 n=1 Tax=Planococcus citri TaxID=170843 RepID=UPI0031F8ECA7